MMGEDGDAPLEEEAVLGHELSDGDEGEGGGPEQQPLQLANGRWLCPHCADGSSFASRHSYMQHRRKMHQLAPKVMAPIISLSLLPLFFPLSLEGWGAHWILDTLMHDAVM